MRSRSLWKSRVRTHSRPAPTAMARRPCVITKVKLLPWRPLTIWRASQASARRCRKRSTNSPAPANLSSTKTCVLSSLPDSLISLAFKVWDRRKCARSMISSTSIPSMHSRLPVKMDRLPHYRALAKNPLKSCSSRLPLRSSSQTSFASETWLLWQNTSSISCASIQTHCVLPLPDPTAEARRCCMTSTSSSPLPLQQSSPPISRPCPRFTP